MSRASDAPPVRQPRVVGYDVARAIAILGMILVHFPLMMADDWGEPVWMSRVLNVIDGRAAAMFMVLAGIGVTLISRRALDCGSPHEIGSLRLTLIRRSLFLLVAGFINLVVWTGDILRIYGISLFLAATLVTAPNRKLLRTAMFFVAGFFALFVIFAYDEHWDWDTLHYEGLWTPAGIIRNLFYDGMRSIFPWTAFILLGMWLGRFDLRARRVNRIVFLIAAAAALSAEAVSYAIVSFLTSHGIDEEAATAFFGTESMPPFPLFLLAAAGTAVAVIAACVNLTELIPSRNWQPLSATGQLALTWYVCHIALLLVLSLFTKDSLRLDAAAAWGFAFFSAAIVGSSLWKLQFQRGPVEALMRAVTG